MRIITFLCCGSLLLVSGLSAATFTSQANGNWNDAPTWSVSGFDPDGIPDSNDDVIISNNNTVTDDLASNYSRSLTVNAGCTLNFNTKAQRIYGSLANSGTLLGVGSLVFYGSGFTISSTTTITNGGNWFFLTGANYTINAGTAISKINYININPGASVTNNGQVNLTAGSLTLSGTWTNGANSSLAVARDITGGGTLNCSAVPNTMSYTSNQNFTVIGTTYYNLVLSSISSLAVTKTLTAAPLVVQNNFFINAGVTFDAANQNITVGGNWSNNGNTNVLNIATVTFNGSGTQNINRTAAERFATVVKSGTGTLNFNTNLTITGSLTISAGTMDATASNRSITLSGNFTNNGTYNARQGTLTLNGGVAQTLSGASTTTLYNVTSTNAAGVSVQLPVILQNILQVSNGSFSPSGAGSMILVATGPTTCAKIGPLGATASLGGTAWSIQSYVNGPATAYWQYLGTPVNGTTLNDWDQDPGFYMSGVGGNDGNACCPVFRSVRTYNTATNSYTNITSTATVLQTGLGYMIWMANNMSQLTAPLVFDSRGMPNFGTKTRNVTAGGAGAGYNLVSNPYACPITFASVVAASGNIGPNFLILQENGNYTTNPNGGVIAGAQGFMVIASSTGNMTFTEACKNTAANPNIIRQGDPENFLRISTSNGVNGLGGEIVVALNNDAINGSDMYDMPFLPSPYDDATNLWTTDKDGKELLMNSLDGNADVLDIPLSVKANTIGDQFLAFRGLNGFSSYSCAVLVDLGTGEKIDLKAHDTYSYFSSQIGDRHEFILHFERTGDCPLSEQNLTSSLDALSQVYVNNGNIMVQFGFQENTNVEISVYNTAGQEVAAPKQVTVGAETVMLDGPDAHGVYFVRIVRGDEVVTKKIYY